MDGPEDLEENLKDKNQFPGLPNLHVLQFPNILMVFNTKSSI